MSILILDDERDVRESLQIILELAGHKVVTAASGDEALGYVKDNEINLMLVDLSMPGMSGEEFLRKVWDTAQWPPALVITGAAPWQTVGLIELGVGYIRKPFNHNVLLGTVETYLRKGGTRWE